MNERTNTLVGIEDVGISLPSSFLPIETLAEARDIPAQKLTKGLGLGQIAFCSDKEDIASLISDALIDLVRSSEDESSDHQSWFDQIDRIYLGTESAIDGSKPTISYAVDLVSKELGVNLERIDFVDMTFACIGGVDALQICRDYVELNPDRKCIVVAGDIAKYDLNSGGEYTQGAGAIALLISASPKMVALDSTYGVSAVHEFDFYKPVRRFSKKDFVKDLSESLDLSETQRSKLGEIVRSSLGSAATSSVEGEINSIWEIPSDYIPVLRKEPTYDGRYSNQCYESRIHSALQNFLAKSDGHSIEEFGAWLFHLPYSYQGRRTAVRYWYEEIVKRSDTLRQSLQDELSELDVDQKENYSAWLKAVSKTKSYRAFVNQKIAPAEKMSSQIGNMYTASIFMGMLSHIAYSESPSKTEEQLLFLAYGSGSKAKVFSGAVNADFDRSSLKGRLENRLQNRRELTFSEYESLHAQS